MDEVLKQAANGDSGLFWPLVVWVLIREIIPTLIKKLRNGKTPYMEVVKEKVDFLYIREKKRETIEEYKDKQRNRRSSDRKET